MIIKFQIFKSAILEEVKNATYLKGQMDSAADEKATKLSYQETAGTEEVHERTLTHDFQTALEMVKLIFIDYLTPTAQTIGDNVIYYNDKTDDIIAFSLNVSRRYNGTLTDTLARLTAKYVEDYMIFQWWLKTTNLKQAEPYQSFLITDEQNIRKCFIMSGPVLPTVPYTSSLTVRMDGSEIDGEIDININEKEAFLSYSIDGGAVDDIEAKSSDPSILGVHRCVEPHCFWLQPVNTGFVTLTLFSRHSDKMKVEVKVTITQEED